MISIDRSDIVSELRSTADAYSFGMSGNTSVLVRAASEIERLRDELNSAIEDIGHHKMAASDRDRLVRELDVALNGEAGAAMRPALCDVVSQVKDQRWKLVRGA